MYKTTFRIDKMDCPSEEQMIRMKLEGKHGITVMEFDIPNRLLHVFHSSTYKHVLDDLNTLQLDTTFVASKESDPQVTADNPAAQRKLLWKVLLINAVFFVLEIFTGFWSQSMGLVADSLDMLADTVVYALALMAVGGTVALKKQIARISGYFQMLLAVLGLTEVARRFIGTGTMPHFQTMMVISVLALIGNAWCLYLLMKSKSEEAHMKASMIFTSNDVIVNIGVIIAGALVYFTKSPYPDLIIGTVVFILVARGAWRIIHLGK